MEKETIKRSNGQPLKETEAAKEPDNGAKKPPRKHLIKCTWLRRTLKTLLVVFVVVLLLPVVIYIPPVQRLLVNVACSVIHDSTGMDAHIGSFRLKFPLDVSLRDVSVVEAGGDTMVSAGELIADVRLLPLLQLDVDVNRLQLNRGYYRMVSADSSMIMKIRAGYLEIDDRSAVNIRTSRIMLNRARLRDADISLLMDVWKKKPTPQDTTSTPFLITANDLDIERVSFGMGMLPTIDTLRIEANALRLRGARIDLATSRITARSLRGDKGRFRYITPTPGYIAAHPAPVDTVSSPSPPMRIEADTVVLSNFAGVYGVKGARPQPGFDPSWVEVSNVNLAVNHLYNESADLSLPIQSLTANERCGLRLTSGSGLFKLDSAGITLRDLNITTPYSKVDITAGLPFALMELKPSAPVELRGNLSIGMPDVEAFMPSVESFTRLLPGRRPLTVALEADGTLSDVTVRRLSAGMAGIFRLKAEGEARNALDLKALQAMLTIDGEIESPSTIERFTGKLPVRLPSMRLKGRAGADHQRYTADLQLLTPDGDLAAKGDVALTSERYDAHLEAHRLNVERLMPSLGIGIVSARLNAHGAGFNPTLHGAATDIEAHVAELQFKGKRLADISLQATLHNGAYTVDALSPNPDMDFAAAIAGNIAPDNYSARGTVYLRHADLQALGLSPTMSNGNADLRIDLTASPDRWLYDGTIAVENLDWNLPDQYIHLPAGLTARIAAREHDVTLDLSASGSEVNFICAENLGKVVDSFSAAATEAANQIKARRLMVDALQHQLPQFRLRVNASGKGLLNPLLASSGVSLDTIYGEICNDSILHANFQAMRMKASGIDMDTLGLGLKQRETMLDYRLHIGNRPGTFDEFAQVNLNGYVGDNRLSAFLNQRNIGGETGYRLGLTAAVADDVVSVHFTPLKATLAYMPWTMNDDNHIDLDLKDFHIDANLKASSNESSILLLSGADAGGDEDEFHLNLTNIHLQDFLQMSVYAPPLKATVNADVKVRYNSQSLTGSGSMQLSELVYNRVGIPDLNLKFGAAMEPDGDSKIGLALNVDDHDAVKLGTILHSTPDGLQPETVRLILDRFPLSLANAFTGPQTAVLSGAVSGDMRMTGRFDSPILNGSLRCNDAAVRIPMLSTTFKLGQDSLQVADNVIRFDKFNILAANSNPLVIDGSVNAKDISNIILDLSAQGSDFMLTNTNRKNSDGLYGKLILNLGAHVSGPVNMLDITGNVSVLSGTDAFYTVGETQSSIAQTDNSGVVKFVNFNDSTAVVKADTIETRANMRLNAQLTIVPGAKFTVNLAPTGTDRVVVNPSGTLSFYQNYMGDMTLNGQLFLGEGSVRYTVMKVKSIAFDIKPESYILWNGALLNPVVNLQANDEMKVNVMQSGGNSHIVNFIVELLASGTLSHPNLRFDLSADDDMSIQNELQGMTADQRSQQAMNLLLTGRYSGVGGTKNVSGNFLDASSAYSILTSGLNSLLAEHVKGVDLSFGVDQYDKSVNGQSSTTTSYSYQMSKSLFNNRFKINVGGNYSTDASADENLTENLISDISFEYILKQTSTLTMYAKLFRHTGYESILEGEITETGVGFVMRRRLGNLRSLFRFRRRNRNAPQLPTDSLPAPAVADSTGNPASAPEKGGGR